jgi:death-on-curing protein
MSERVQFLSVDEVCAIHERLGEIYGGRGGLRDEGMLEASLFRPQSGCYEDVAAMAAALFDSMLFNHAFHSGNQRLAFFAADSFLRLNGWKIRVDAQPALNFIGELAASAAEQRLAILPLFRRSIVGL